MNILTFYDFRYTLKLKRRIENMTMLSNAIKNTVSISLFNKGLAGKVFDEVKKTGAKLVIKNNNPEAVIMSPEEYINLVDELNDAKLLAEATIRMQNADLSKTISHEEMMKKFGITQAELEEMDDVEIE